MRILTVELNRFQMTCLDLIHDPTLEELGGGKQRS
jgi:hypothetical protein